MYNKTFKFLDENPKLFITFSIPIIILFIGYFICYYLGYKFDNVFNIGPSIVHSKSLTIFLFTILIIIGDVLCSIFWYLYIYAQINNLLSAKDIIINYKNNLKESWYRLILTRLIMFFAIIIGLIFSLLIGSLLSTVLIVAILVFVQISSVYVIIEDTWKKGIIKTFKSFNNIFFRQ